MTTPNVSDGRGPSPTSTVGVEPPSPTPLSDSWGSSAAWHGALPTHHQDISAPVPPHAAPRPLPTIDGYEIERELGRGGMGVVYKARQPELDRPVAIKMILSGTHASDEDRARFRAEAELVAQLHHPNIVQIYEVGERDGAMFCSLEFINGPNLAQQLAGKPIPAHPAALLARDLAWAVQYAHQRGIIHRDLKPANILLRTEQPSSWSGTHAPAQPVTVPKITDFGLAKSLLKDSDLTATGAVLGTPSYMAPEQASGSKHLLGPPTDVYALGAILYELLTGRPPFKEDSSWDTILKVVGCDPIPLRQLQQKVPVALETICMKCLAKAPTDRYLTAAALAEDLDRFLNGAAISARPEGWVRRQVRKVRRHPWMHATAVLLLILACGVAGFGWWQNHLRLREASAALVAGQERIRDRQFSDAARTLTQGIEVARQAQGAQDVAAALEEELARARRGLAAQELHKAADHVRFLLDPEALATSQALALSTQCRTLWEARERIASDAGPRLDKEMEQQIRTDLLDLAVMWGDLHVRLASGADAADAARREALEVLATAESLFGPSHVLARQRQLHAAALKQPDVARAAEDQARSLPPRSAWEHYALGRSLLRAGRLDEAVAALDQAIDRYPQAFWPQFYRGIAAYQLKKYDDAIVPLSMAAALAEKEGQPGQAAQCYYHRALTHEKQPGRADKAIGDYTRALEKEPGLVSAAINRSLLYVGEKHYDKAVADLLYARDHGASPALIYRNLASVHLKRSDKSAALACVAQWLHHDAGNKEALALRLQLLK